MADKKLNIEIGERLIKVCVTAGSKRTLMPLQSFMFMTPAGSVSDGQINDAAAIAGELKQQLSIKGIKCRSVVFSLVSGKVAAREVGLPPIKEKRLKALVESNAAEYFPVDMSKYHITYTILGNEKKDEEESVRVLVLAAPLAILEGYFKIAEAAGLQIAAIDYSGNSQFRALENKCGGEVTMCINVDCNSTNISFIKGKRLMLQRVLSIGAEELILNYMSAAGLPDENYIDALQTLSSGDSDAILSALPESDIKESLSRLIGNIVRTAEYFNSSNWETPVEKFVLLGSCCRIVGLTEELAEAVSLPIAHLNSLPGFENLQPDSVRTISTNLCCVGSSIQPVDFMPAQFTRGKKKERQKSDSIASTVVFLIVALLFAGAISAFAILNYMSAQQDKADLEKKIAFLEDTEATYLAYIDYQNGVKDLDTLALLTDSPNDGLVAFIGELEKKMPKEIRVLSAVCSITGVDMNVIVNTKEQAAMVIVQLRSFESISGVSAGAIAETTDDTGLTYVSFAVSSVYKDTSPAPDLKAEKSAPAKTESSDATE